MGQSMSKPGVSSRTVMQSGVHRRAARAGSLVTAPHTALERESFAVDPRDPEVVEVAAALIGTMKATPGCRGLSAPQLGHDGRIICVDVTGHALAKSCAGLIVLANPEILTVSGTIVMREECTSFPGVVVDVSRASRVVVGGVIPGSGREVVIEADAFEARCLLHEIDHLDGISMLDRIVDSRSYLHGR
jgi:peptide deformylase